MKTQSFFFKFLSQANTKQRKVILSTLTKEQLDVLSEVAPSIYKGVFPNKHKYVKVLKPYKSLIWQIGSKSIENSQKMKLLIKKQNIIQLLLQPVLDYLK
jgi:hypothetical protein